MKKLFALFLAVATFSVFATEQVKQEEKKESKPAMKLPKKKDDGKSKESKK